MNKERVLKCIKMMEGAKALNMREWQHGLLRHAKTIEELHACGNTACFAGYLAISDFFREAGGTMVTGGCPAYNDISDYEAVAEFLDISCVTAEGMVHGDLDYTGHSEFYNKPWREVTNMDVVAKLQLIFSGELV